MTWLGRWRIDGTNWEGRQWYLNPSGVALAKELNILWPRSHPADGTAASKAHDDNNPSSDHRPYPYDASPAVVNALDAGEVTENDGQALFDMLLETRDPRIKYVLHENKIFSSYSRPNRDAWEVKEGTYGHLSHVHISFTNLEGASPWNLGEGMVDRNSKADDGNPTLADNFDQMVQAGVFSEHTQPGGVTFNDEFATFLIRFENYIKAKYDLGSAGLTEDQVKAIINGSQIVAPD